MKGWFNLVVVPAAANRQKQRTPVEVHLKEDVILIFKRSAGVKSPVATHAEESWPKTVRDAQIGTSDDDDTVLSSSGLELEQGHVSDAAGNEHLLITIRFSEIIGCHRMKSFSLEDSSAYFAVYSYPRVKIGRFGSLMNRIRHVHTFEASKKKKYHDNCRESAVWVEEIRKRIRISPPPHKLDQSVEKQRCLYVLVNPHSGPGKALHMFQYQVLPVLVEANTICKLVITERAHHAKELAQKLDLNIWDGLVLVSGDGLIFEVLNGFLLREDREEALKMPLGIIPGGSGNAMASSISYSCGESILGEFALQTAVMVARPRYMPLKLIHVETETDHYACFMGVAWGIIADIDIESEKYRNFLGTSRFFYYAFVRCCNMRTYKARLSYLRYEGETPPESSHSSRKTISRSVSEVHGISNAVFQKSQPDELYKWESNENLSRWSENKENDRLGVCGKQRQRLEVEFAGRTTTDDGLKGMGDCLVSKAEELEKKRSFWSRRHVPKNVPPLSEPVPDDWTVEEDDFVMVVGCFMSHLGEDIIFMPTSSLNDGIIYLCVVRGTASRPQVVNVMFNFSSGQHVTHSCFEIIPVRAYRLEPLGERKGIITVDGELANTSKVQVVTTFYCANVMGR